MSASASALAYEPAASSSSESAVAQPQSGTPVPRKNAPPLTARALRMSGGGDWTWRRAAPFLAAWLLFYAVAIAGALREDRSSKETASFAKEPALASTQ